MDDYALFRNRQKILAFVLRSLQSMLNFEVEILSLQQLEYEMYHTDYPVNYNCFEIGYCGHPNFSYENVKFKQATYFFFLQEDDPPFIHDTL